LKCVGCTQGKLASSAVLSNLYAMGVTECDNMLMHVGVSQKMSDKERDAVLPLLATGFKVSASATSQPKHMKILALCVESKVGMT